MENENKTEEKISYLYEVKNSFVTQTERPYILAIEKVLPESYYIQPQVCLRSVIERTDTAYYQNELFKIVDAAVFEKGTYRPILLVEINDSTHNQPKRIERDKKVKMICEEAGLPLIIFWTKFGVDEYYIQKRILKGIEDSKNPVRVAHSHDKTEEKVKEEIKEEIQETAKSENDTASNETKVQQKNESSGGCYIATCVYGSYDCPQVWTLRRFRDFTLAKNFFGRIFIKMYYAISPKLVQCFGDKKGFVRFWKKFLDCMIHKLQRKGFEDTPYYDR